LPPSSWTTLSKDTFPDVGPEVGRRLVPEIEGTLARHHEPISVQDHLVSLSGNNQVIWYRLWKAPIENRHHVPTPAPPIVRRPAGLEPFVVDTRFRESGCSELKLKYDGRARAKPDYDVNATGAVECFASEAIHAAFVCHRGKERLREMGERERHLDPDNAYHSAGVHEIACPTENELYMAELLNWRMQKLTLRR
jgi:hypothetical protein